MIIKPPNKIISLIELRHLRPIELPHFVTTCPRVRVITQLHLNTTDKRAPPTERPGDSNDFNDLFLALLCFVCFVLGTFRFSFLARCYQQHCNSSV